MTAQTVATMLHMLALLVVTFLAFYWRRKLLMVEIENERHAQNAAAISSELEKARQLSVELRRQVRKTKERLHKVTGDKLKLEFALGNARLTNISRGMPKAGDSEILIVQFDPKTHAWKVS